MKSTILLVSLFLLALPTVSICEEEELPLEWTFDDEDSIEKWSGANQLLLEIDDVKDKEGNERRIHTVRRWRV